MSCRRSGASAQRTSTPRVQTRRRRFITGAGRRAWRRRTTPCSSAARASMTTSDTSARSRDAKRHRLQRVVRPQPNYGESHVHEARQRRQPDYRGAPSEVVAYLVVGSFVEHPQGRQVLFHQPHLQVPARTVWPNQDWPVALRTPAD